MSDATNLEAIARRLCEAEGFDPEERVDVEFLDRLTDVEQMSHRSEAGETHVRVARWLTYRSRAEQIVTAGRASD
jgi:hypothetical protein